MIALISDEDFRGSIIRGIRRREPTVDIVRVQEAGLMAAPDPHVLEWAAQHRRVVTHDARTMTRFAYERLDEGLAMRGVLVVPQWLKRGSAIEQIIYTALCSDPEEFDLQVRYLPVW